MKVKNVIKGYMSREEITLLTIIKGYDVQYCGDVNSFLNCSRGHLMYEFAEELKNSDVIGKDLTNFSKLFIFI